MKDFWRCRQASWHFFFRSTMAAAVQEFSQVRAEATVCQKKLPLSLEARISPMEAAVYARNQNGPTLARRTSYSNKGDIS